MLQVAFDASNALAVATNDRVGFYGSASVSGLRKLNIPYATENISGSPSVQVSRQRFNESLAPFVAGQLQITVQDTRLPRTFASYLRLCGKSGRRLEVVIHFAREMLILGLAGWANHIKLFEPCPSSVR